MRVNRRVFETSSEDIGDWKISPGDVYLYKSDDHVKNFIYCVFSGRRTAAPVEVAHRSITLGHLGNIGLLTGRALKWDPDKEVIVDDPGASDLLRRNSRAPWAISPRRYAAT